MPSYDYLGFAPSESAYSQPGEWESAQRARSLERATTLSELERFYKSLDEQGRQFDVELAAKERMFGEQLGEQRYEFDTGLGFSREQLAENSRQFGETHELETRRFEFEEKMGPQWLALQKDIASSQASQGWSQNDMGWMAGGMSLLGNWGEISGGVSSIWDSVSSWF